MATQCYKLVLLGESAVGKSSVVLRLVKQQFHDYEEATIGAAFLTHTIVLDNPAVNVKFEIWDTAGQERYHSLAPMYYRGAHAAVVVYDITNANSFDRAKTWVSELNKASNSPKVIALTGNKVDLEDQRAVFKENAKAYADEHDLIFMETSAKRATNITELFMAVAEKLPRNSKPSASGGGGQQITPDNSNPTHNACCK